MSKLPIPILESIDPSMLVLGLILVSIGLAAFALVTPQLPQGPVQNAWRQKLFAGTALGCAGWFAQVILLNGRPFQVLSTTPCMFTIGAALLSVASGIAAVLLATRFASGPAKALSGGVFGIGLTLAHFSGMTGAGLDTSAAGAGLAMVVTAGVAITGNGLAAIVLGGACRRRDRFAGVLLATAAIAATVYTGLWQVERISNVSLDDLEGFEQSLVLSILGLFALMLVATAVTIAMGNNPRQLWRRYIVAGVLILPMVIGVYFASDRSISNSERYAELSRLVAEQQAWRADLQAASERHLEALARGDFESMPPTLHNDVHAFYENNQKIRYLLQNTDVNRDLKRLYFGQSFFDAEVQFSIHEESLKFYNAVKSTFGIGSRFVDLADVDTLALETAYIDLSQRVVSESVRSSRDAHLVEAIALLGGLLIFVFQGAAIFLPAHRSINAAFDELEAEKAWAERLAVIAEYATDAVMMTDSGGHLEWANAAFTDMSGHELEDVLGQRISSFMRHEDTDLDQVRRMLREIAAGRSVTEDVLLAKRDGTAIWVSLALTPIYNEEGTLATTVHVARDITEQKRLQDEVLKHRDHLAEMVEERTQTIRNQTFELEKALAAERELNQMQTEFVSMASHEFRTPLTIIDGTARRLDKRADRFSPDEIREKAATIRSTVKRMTMLVERTLDASRLSSGRIKLTPEMFNARALIEDVCARQAEVSPGHEIAVDVAGYPKDLFGDGRLLDNVFTNMLSNAVKYSRDNPRVQVKGFVEGATAVLKVKDFGVGIAKEELPKIFQRFFRARTSTGISGTGIGLNLVKNLVDMHHGSVSIDSEEGAWTEITLRLPIDSPLAQKKHAEAPGPASDLRDAS